MTDIAAPDKLMTITTKHLAHALAEQHQLTNKQGLGLLEDLIGLIIIHLKNGERVKIAGLGILQVRIVLPAWAAIQGPARQSRSRPAKRSPSAPARNSRRRSECPATDSVLDMAATYQRRVAITVPFIIAAIVAPFDDCSIAIT